MAKDDLLRWADTELYEKAEMAYAGQGDFHCGEWCRFCKAKAECRERAEANLALAQYDFEAPALLEDSEIADMPRHSEERKAEMSRKMKENWRKRRGESNDNSGNDQPVHINTD